MATRVIAAQDKTTSGAGDDVQIKAGNANTSGAGGNILLVPGIQATTGGNGIVRIAPPSNGSSATLELVEPVFNYGMKLSMDDYYYATLGFTNAGSLALSIPSNMYIWNNGGISAKGATATGFGYSSSTTNLNISYLHMRETGVITFYGAAGVAYGSVGQIKVTNGSTGGGSLAYTSSTPTALSTNPTNDLVLTGSAFQRLSASSAVSLTGIAPPSTGSHVDGRLIWLYNVGSFNITLKHSQTSTAANQFVNEGGGDIVLGPNRVVQAIYDATTTKWRVNGETYPYVFPTTDGTNGQVLTTNGSGTLSWTTVSAGATASGTTNYIAKFTGASTLGNSLIFDNGTSVGIGTASPGHLLHLSGANDNTTNYYSQLRIDGTGTYPQNIAGISLNSNAAVQSHIRFLENGTVKAQFRYNEGNIQTNKLTVYSFITASNILTIDCGTQLVGINSYSPGAQLEIDTISAGTKGLIVKGFLNQSANLTEWQNNSGTVLASVDNLGRHIKSYNSASGLSTFSVGKTVLGAVHFTNGAGSGTSARNEAAITFQGGSATEAQAGIYVTNDNTTGTHMALATTDNYTSGPQLGLTISNTGAISFPRASIVSTPAVCSIGSNSNDGGVLKLYSSGFGLRITSLNGDIISGDVNSVNITPGAAGNTTGLNVVANMGANGTVAGFTNNGNVGSKVVVIKGKAAQTGNLTEWQDSTGAVVASVSPTGAFFGSSYTSYGTVDSATQIFGNNYWTPNMTGGVTSSSAGTYTKSSGTTDWNAQVYSSEGYIKNVYCSAQASQTTGYIMFGLNSDPTTDAVYSSLDYAWYVQQGGVLAIWENNAQIATYGSYTTSTVLSITYDGTNVRYWKDGVLQRTVARSVGNPLYLDSSFHTLSSSLNSVQFGPIGQPFGISGTSGYHPKFTSQQTLGNSIVYDNGTNVGIGTASPADRLEVSGATNKNVKIGTVAGGLDTSSYNPDISTLGGIVGFQTGISTDYRGSIYAYADSSSNAKLAISSRSDIVFVSYKGNNADSRAMVIKETTGNVGIGTASPSFKLQVDAASVDANIVANVTSGYGGIGVYVAGVNKVVLGYAGANANYGSQTIAGDVVIKTNNSNLHINTGSGNSVTTAYFSSAGNVGIGTASPSYRLQVSGQTYLGNGASNPLYIDQTVADGVVRDSVYLYEASAQGTGRQAISWYNGNQGYYKARIYTEPGPGYAATRFYIDTADNARTVATRLCIHDGNVGINTTSPGAKLQVDTGATGTKGLLLKAVASQSANLLEVQNNAGTVLTNIDSGGNLTVATTSSAYTYYSTNTTARWATGHDSSNGYFRIVDYVWDGTTRLMITPGGNVVLGNAGGDQTNGPKLLVTTGPDTSGGTGAARKGLIVRGSASQTANLQEWQNSSSTALAYMDASGNFFAVSKSFLIDHPTPAKAAEGKKLRYASLEGPENGVYFRGRLERENEIVLPDYWKDLVDPESITVNLTPRKRPQPNLFVVDANGEKVVVESDREICCDFIVYGTRKDIAKLEVEVNGN